MIGGLFLWSTCFTKLSVLLFYRRLVAGTYSKLYKIALWSAMGVILAYTLIMFSLLVGTCTPVDAFWRKFDPAYMEHYHCTGPRAQTKVSQLTGSLSVITDFYSVLLPALLVFRMTIPRRQRIALMLVFGLGVL
jgi:hypothetical protein